MISPESEPGPGRIVLPPGHEAPLLHRPTGSGLLLEGRMHLAVVLKPLVGAVQFLGPILLVFAMGDAAIDFILWSYGILFGIQTVSALVRFSTFRYVLTTDGLTMRWGLLTHRTRTIPLARIINMNTRRALWHRIFGAEEVRFETAGGVEEEAVIEGLSRARSREIRAAVRMARDERSVGPAQLKQDDVLRQLTLRDTILHGMTSNLLAALGGIVGLVLENVDSLDFLDVDLEGWLGQANPLEISSGAAGLLLVVWLGSVVYSLVRFWGFTLRRSESGDLSTRFGLLTVHAGRIFTGKVQALVVHESFLRRPFRLATVKVLSAGSTAVEEPSAMAEFLLPIARFRDVGPLVGEVFPGFGDWPDLERVHPLAVRRNIIRVSILPVIAIVAFSFRWNQALYLLPLWALIAVYLAIKSYRNTGYRLLDDYVVVRRGIFTLTTHVVPKARLQAMIIHRNPFDRRLGLSSLLMDTAARSSINAPRIPDITPQDAAEIRTDCLTRYLERRDAKGAAPAY